MNEKTNYGLFAVLAISIPATIGLINYNLSQSVFTWDLLARNFAFVFLVWAVSHLMKLINSNKLRLNPETLTDCIDAFLKIDSYNLGYAIVSFIVMAITSAIILAVTSIFSLEIVSSLTIIERFSLAALAALAFCLMLPRAIGLFRSKFSLFYTAGGVALFLLILLAPHPINQEFIENILFLFFMMEFSLIYSVLRIVASRIWPDIIRRDTYEY